MNPLVNRLSQYIKDPHPDSFDSCAFALFNYHYARNAPYRRLCDATGSTPRNVSSWRQIPAVPAQAFKSFDLSCAPVDSCPAVFYSSGTTAAATSKHYMDQDALNVYELSLQTGYAARIPATQSIWAVMPGPAVAPHSSLTRMLSALGAVEFAGQELTHFARLLAHLSRSQPITLFGTALGLLALGELTPGPLPAGSILVETGGFKGRTLELSRAEFYSVIQSSFAVPDHNCYSEYGMCEMASQFYSRGVGGALLGPPWVRTRCIDPLTGSDAAPGEPGLLRHIDLANYNSVLALQTQDRALIHADGSFVLLGRASDAELRGCSLTAEEMWIR